MLDGVEGDAVIADKAYDSKAIRAQVKAAGMKAVIPSKLSRTRRFRHNKALYRERNRIERCFNKLKHFRRLATRYDRRACHFLALTWKRGGDNTYWTLILRNACTVTFDHFELMMAMVEEQNRLKARIADFELSIAETREIQASTDRRFMGDAEQDQMLQMLLRTLQALKAREAAL